MKISTKTSQVTFRGSVKTGYFLSPANIHIDAKNNININIIKKILYFSTILASLKIFKLIY